MGPSVSPTLQFYKMSRLKSSRRTQLSLRPKLYVISKYVLNKT